VVGLLGFFATLLQTSIEYKFKMKQKLLLRLLIVHLLFFSSRLEAQKSSCLFPKNQTYTKNTFQALSVNSVPSAINYRFQISTNIGFAVILKDTVTAVTSFNFNFSNTNQVYYWRTKAYVIGDSTGWSSSFSLIVFSPKNIPNVVMWLSAQNINLADNTPVSLWNDLSNNSYNATQAILSKQPKYKISGGIRNKPYVDFNTNSLITTITTTIIPNDSTLGFVSLNLNRPAGYGALFYMGNSGSLLPKFVGRTGGSSYSDGSFRYLGYDGAVFSFDLRTPNASYKIMSGYDNNKIAKLFSGSKEVVSSTAYKVNVSSSATLKIGSNQDAGENFNGGVHEFILLRNTTDTSIYRSLEKLIDCDYIPRANLGGNIFKPYGFCDSSITLNPGLGYASYLWSNGATTPTIIIAKFGTYSVTITDELGYKHTDEMTYRPNIYFRYPSKNIICANDSIVWDSKIPPSYTVTWSDGKVGVKNSIKTAGKYYFTIQDVNLCTYTSDTITFTLDNFPQTASLGIDTSFCIGNPIYLKTGASQAVSYVWSDGSTNSSLSVLVAGQYSVTATSINGCIKKDTVNIGISGVAPTANFSITPTTCIGSTTQFTDASISPVGNSIVSRIWDFGDASPTSNLSSPSYTYADTGSYTAKLTVITNAGCSASFLRKVTIAPYPKPSFSVSNLCERDSVLFNGTATTYGYPITQWGWSFGESFAGPGFTSNLQNPKHFYANAATYTVSLTIKNTSGCNTIINKPVFIQSSPVTKYSTSLLCEKQAIIFTDITTVLPTVAIQFGAWDFGDNSAITPLINPIHTYAASGKYILTHTITANNGCSNINTQTLTVNPLPKALYTVGNVCTGLPAVFSDTSLISSGSVANRLWTYGAGGATSILKNNLYTFVTAITPQVKLLVTSDQGCKDSITKTIVVRPTPVAKFTATPNNGAPSLNVNFINNSLGAAKYAWNLGNTHTDTLQNTHTIYTDTASYKVSLIAVSQYGCADTSIQKIDVLLPIIDIAVKSITTLLNNQFMTVQVLLLNKGTIDVTSLDITIEINDGTALKEHWTGLLLRGGIVLDTIATSIYMKDSKRFVCVSAVKPNNMDDLDSADNESCTAIDKSTFEVLAPYPVPAGEVLTLPVLIPATNNLEVTVYNSRGQSLGLVHSGTVAEGLQLISVNLKGIEKGVYSFVVVYDGQNIVKRFVVN
jgi:PKD repeat protein